jgi:glycosyltransferase involved in cell wall biosynthesis
MHVAQISFFLDPRRDAAQILQDWWPLVDAADMVVQAGASVSVIQACRESRLLTHHGVNYHFVASGPSAACASSDAFAQIVRELKPDIFHVHGLGFSRDVLALAALSPGTPIFLQDHAERVPSLWRRRAFRRGLSMAAGVSFCALAQGQPFTAAGLFDSRTHLSEIPETSSRFAPADQNAARATTGLRGDPAVLWVGHLNANKDPLTVLAGVSAAVRYLPQLQLWCCFGSAPLMPEVRARIEADPHLRGRVHLLGKVAHGEVEELMRAADIFVLGSHKEGSGCSVIEALACGLPPVVTDIPSFRALTGDGRVGALWPRGDAKAMCTALLSVASGSRGAMRTAVRAHFDGELSFQAVGRKLITAYERALRPRVTGESEQLSCV